MIRRWETPAGECSGLYEDMLCQNHLLIAGTTGSGKSVVISGIMHAALFDSPARVRFVLIDPKMTELVEYKDLPHALAYACEPEAMRDALQFALDLTQTRAADMQRRRLKKYDGSHVYVIIDELADLLTVDSIKRNCKRIIQRLCQIGRAMRVHVIGATQRPTNDVIGNAITVNMDARLALRTRTAQESRNIIGVNGCETLPRHGIGYYMTPELFDLYRIPMVEDEERQRVIDHWITTRPRRHLFKPAM